jgi:glyoxylase-like metal-dependent hydrolase (beta-lactamase superfamily II)
MKIVQESEHVYRLSRLGLVNCFLVEHDGTCTLIDTNLPGSANAILQAAKKLNLPVHRVLLTHAHFDHVGSLDALATQVPNIEIAIGARESRFLAGDLSLDAHEHGKLLFGFRSCQTKPTCKLRDGDRVGPFLALSCPGHTPGHFAFLDTRDNSLFAGDAFTTQNGLLVAGVFQLTFPFPALFSWNAQLSAQSGAKLRDARPSCLCVGHGKSLVNPAEALDQAVAHALRQGAPSSAVEK